MTIQVRDTGTKGRGVFALVPIAAGQRIEEAPVIAYPAAQKELVANQFAFCRSCGSGFTPRQVGV